MQFDSNLPGLLDEVLSNPTCSILYQPVRITKGILQEMAQLAIDIDDDRLHILMLRLGLYEVNARERVKQIKRLRKSCGGIGCMTPFAGWDTGKPKMQAIPKMPRRPKMPTRPVRITQLEML